MDIELNLTQVKKKAVPILRKSGVIRSAVFGSVARGDAKKNSDIDFLVEFPRGKTLFDLVGLKLDLEEAFKKKVDVVTYNAPHPLLKDYILRDQKLIYEKRRKHIHAAHTGKY